MTRSGALGPLRRASAGVSGRRAPGSMHGALRGLALLAALASTGCAWRTTAPPPAHAAAPPAQPEIATGWSPKPGWNARRFMVAAAHPLAADAGREILQAGGSALDAAIAVQMVLALVEPQSSGIGGGAFLLHWDGRELQAWDGRETAPASRRPPRLPARREVVRVELHLARRSRRKLRAGAAEPIGDDRRTAPGETARRPTCSRGGSTRRSSAAARSARRGC